MNRARTPLRLTAFLSMLLLLITFILPEPSEALACDLFLYTMCAIGCDAAYNDCLNSGGSFWRCHPRWRECIIACQALSGCDE